MKDFQFRLTLNTQDFSVSLKDVENTTEASSEKIENNLKGVGNAGEKVGGSFKDAAKKADFYIDAAGRVRKANGQFATAAEKAAAGFDGIGDAATGAGKKTTGFGDGLSGLTQQVAAFATGQLAALGIQDVLSSLAEGFDVYSTGVNLLSSRLGLGEAELGAYKEALGNVFTQTDMSEETVDMFVKIQQSTKASADDTALLTKRLNALQKSFDIDTKEGVGAMENLSAAFGISYENALDLIAVSERELGVKADVDNLREYSGNLAQLSLDATDLYEIILKTGDTDAYNLDYVLDMYKEFGIRIQDNSESTRNALLQLFGRQAGEELFQGLKDGSITGKEALEKIQPALAGVQDDLKQAELGVALFGTKFEDLGTQTALAVTDLSGAVGEFSGVAAEVQAELSEMEVFSNVLNAIKVQLFELAMRVLPVINKGLSAFSELLGVFGAHRTEVEKTVAASKTQRAEFEQLVGTYTRLQDVEEKSEAQKRVYRETIERLNSQYGEYLGNISLERDGHAEVAAAINSAREALVEKARTEAIVAKTKDLQAGITDEIGKQVDLIKEREALQAGLAAAEQEHLANIATLQGEIEAARGQGLDTSALENQLATEQTMWRVTEAKNKIYSLDKQIAESESEQARLAKETQYYFEKYPDAFSEAEQAASGVQSETEAAGAAAAGLNDALSAGVDKTVVIRYDVPEAVAVESGIEADEGESEELEEADFNADYYEAVKFADSEYYNWKKAHIEREAALVTDNEEQKAVYIKQKMGELDAAWAAYYDGLADKSNMSMAEQVAAVKSGLGNMMGSIGGFLSTELTMQSAAHQERVRQLDAEKEKELAALNSSRASAEIIASQKESIEAKYAAKKEKLAKENELKEKKLRKQQQKVQIAETIMSTHAAAVNAYKSLAGIPFIGPVLGAAAAAAALLYGFKQVEAIRAQKFVVGGYTGSGSDYKDETGKRVAGVVHQNEMVFEETITEPNLSELFGLRALLQKGYRLKDILRPDVSMPSVRVFRPSYSFAEGGYAGAVLGGGNNAELLKQLDRIEGLLKTISKKEMAAYVSCNIDSFKFVRDELLPAMEEVSRLMS